MSTDSVTSNLFSIDYCHIHPKVNKVTVKIAYEALSNHPDKWVCLFIVLRVATNLNFKHYIELSAYNKVNKLSPQTVLGAIVVAAVTT